MIRRFRSAPESISAQPKADITGKDPEAFTALRLRSVACFLFAALSMMLSAVTVSADTYQLICENPRREYVVSFSDGDDNIRVEVSEGLTLYRVLAVEDTDVRHVVVALTVADGPTVRLSLRPYLRMEYWSGNELFQTDACRNP